MESKEKFWYFVGVLVLTILVVRIITYLLDPNIFIGGFELHHFYYGVFLLVITVLLMLFGSVREKLYLILSAVGIGLIIDELFFVLGKVRGGVEYSGTLNSTVVVLVIIIVLSWGIWKWQNY